MDEAGTPQELVLEPPPASYVGTALVLVGAIAVAVGTDTAGALLALPVLLGAAGLLARDALLRPVLRADRDGLTVVDGLRRRHARWAQVDGVEVVTDRRSALLSLDLDGHVVLVSRRRTGRPPDEVARDLLALRL